jgi:peptide/nickel transport system permease protein
MSVGAAAPIVRMTRTNLLDVLSDDYVRTARGKGLSEAVTLWHHALRNALIPTIEVILSRVPGILGGVIVMESVFALPGLGRAMVDAVSWRDYTTLQAIVLFNAFLVLAFNLIADLAYAWADPRIRYD